MSDTPLAQMLQHALQQQYDLRHVQHHIGRLHSLLGRAGLRLDWH